MDQKISEVIRVSLLIAITFTLNIILILSLSFAQTNWITLEDVIVNNGITDEVGVFQILRIDVVASSFGAPQSVNITVGVNIYNSSGLVSTSQRIEEMSPNQNVSYPFEYLITPYWNTGYYTAEAFVVYNQNGTNITLKKNATFKVVSLYPIELRMGHEDLAPGEVALFLQEILNNGTTPANATVKVWIEYDNPNTDKSPDITMATEPPVEETISNGTYTIKIPWKVPDTLKGCEYTNSSRYNVYSTMKYGYGDFFVANYLNGLNVTYLEVDTENYGGYYHSGLDQVEAAPGGTVSGGIELLNRGFYPVVVHEVRAWVEDSEGNKILELSPTNLALNVENNAYKENIIPGHNASCSDLGNVTIAHRAALGFPFEGKLPENVSLNEKYKVVFAVDYGVPRDRLEGSPWNIMQNYTFEIVKAEIENLTVIPEVAQGAKQSIVVVIKNVGVNTIDSASVIVDILDPSGNLIKNFSSVVQNLEGGKNYNVSFSWNVPTDIDLGEYTVISRIHYATGVYHAIRKTFRVVRLDILNISSSPVAPYESANITVKILNQGPTNATLKSISLKIKNNTTIDLGTIENISVPSGSIFSINFTYYFDPEGISNGTFDLEAEINYGGLSFKKYSTIVFLPVGIKKFILPKIGNANSTFNVSVVLRNIANSTVPVSLNLTVNGTTRSYAVVNISANSSRRIDFPLNLTSGVHNISIYVDYRSLPESISRSGIISIYSNSVDLSIHDVQYTPTTPKQGDSIKINVTIYNNGSIDAENVLAELLINSEIYENKTINISANSYKTISFIWKNVAAGTHNITIALDPFNNFAERNESDNNISISITVTLLGTTGGGKIVGVGGVGKERPLIKLGITSVNYIFLRNFVKEYKLEGKTFYKAPISVYPILALMDKPVFAEGIEAKDIIEIDGDVYEVANKMILEKFRYSGTVVLARGDIPADAVAAIAFAKISRYPIILTKPDKLVSSALLAIDEISPMKVIIVGGEKAISKEVENYLRERYEVERIWGETRYETAVELAKAYKKKKLDLKVIVVTDGRNISTRAVLISEYMNAPIIYVKDSVPESVLEFLKDNRVDKSRKPIKIIAVDISDTAKRQISEIFADILPTEVEVIVENLDDDDLYVDVFVNKYSKTMLVKSKGTKNYGVFKIKDKEITVKARWLDPDLFEEKLLEKTVTIKAEPGKRKVVWIRINKN